MGQINNLVIVGGGTAGWLTAAYMAKTLSDSVAHKVNITLVESPNIATVGVGEGTWPTLRTTLARIGISETRFMRECHATFKQASKFVNWRQPEGKDAGEFYYHLFDAPSLNWPVDPVPFWLNTLKQDNAPSYAEAISVQQKVCEAALAPKLITTPEYQGLLHYAYHLDAGKFAALLTDVATNELGVNHILADVTRVNLASDGDITSLSTEQAGDIHGDMFIDCTGFASRLLGQALDVPYVDYNKVLLTNRAVTIQVPHPDDHTEVKPYTLSTAKEAGWIWDIGLTHRRGTGYVFSSDFISDEQAEATLREYIGAQAEGLNARFIPIRPGRRAQVWKRNCLGIGLSAAFMEPLEASAIFLIEAACYMLSDMFPARREDMDYVASQFNQSFAYRWDKVVEFIKLHYVLSNRDDTPFWQANHNPATWPDGLAQRLSQWQKAPPSKYEFNHAFEPFTRESYEFILFGMQGKERLSALSEGYALQSDLADQAFAAMDARWDHAKRTLVSHRTLLDRLQKDGFVKPAS